MKWYADRKEGDAGEPPDFAPGRTRAGARSPRRRPRSTGARGPLSAMSFRSTRDAGRRVRRLGLEPLGRVVGKSLLWRGRATPSLEARDQPIAYARLLSACGPTALMNASSSTKGPPPHARQRRRRVLLIKPQLSASVAKRCASHRPVPSGSATRKSRLARSSPS